MWRERVSGLLARQRLLPWWNVDWMDGVCVAGTRAWTPPRALCPTHVYCSDPFRSDHEEEEEVGKVGGGWEWVTSLHFSPDLQIICQTWEDKHVFYMLDLLLSEGRPLLACLTKSCPWKSVCIVCVFVFFWWMRVSHESASNLIFLKHLKAWKTVPSLNIKKKLTHARYIPERIVCPSLVLSFVCKYPCSHETETNG